MLYRCIESTDDATTLQEDLAKLEAWENKWLMSFNAKKCEHITITSKRKPTPTSYKLHNHTLERVKNVKYLGVTINEKLSWEPHINAVVAKANRNSAYVCRSLRGTSRKTKRNAYISIVRPSMEYSSTVWDPGSQGLIDKLEMVQRKTARRIYNDFSKETSPTYLLNELELPPLIARRKANKISFISKILNKETTVAKPETLQKNHRNTRGHTMKLKHLTTRTNYLKNSFFPSSVREWNSLPEDLISPSIASKEKICQHFSTQEAAR